MAAFSAGPQARAQPSTHSSRLREITGFGANPGNLRMFAHVPEQLPSAPALVVVLHGCGQSAAGYNEGAGWSTLADRYGFVLLLPEQQNSNNAQNCFNWFEPGDAARDRGEALSIWQMVDRMVRDHGIDRQRVFVTGLSAGGAMTSVMLAAYPEVFTGGAIIAGLPYGSATSVAEAMEGMFQGRTRSAREWGDLVRRASPHKGPWPKVQIWHGSADMTVRPMNAGEIVKQWTDVHGLSAAPSREGTVDGYPCRSWSDGRGDVVVEEFTITGMAHGTPLHIAAEESFGAAGPFLLDVGIASSYHIARFWGLAGAEPPIPLAESGLAADQAGNGAARRASEEAEASAIERTLEAARASGFETIERVRYRLEDVQSAISKALRSAGLLK